MVSDQQEFVDFKLCTADGGSGCAGVGWLFVAGGWTGEAVAAMAASDDLALGDLRIKCDCSVCDLRGAGEDTDRHQDCGPGWRPAQLVAAFIREWVCALGVE